MFLLKGDLKFIVLDGVCLVFPSLCSAGITEFQEAVCGWAALQKEPIVFHLNPCSSKSPHTALGVCVYVCVMYPVTGRVCKCDCIVFKEQSLLQMHL